MRTTNGKPCEVFGKDSIWRCKVCGKHLCTVEKRKWNGLKCFFMYHSHEFYGLSKSDSKTVHGLASNDECESPTDAIMKMNVSRIKKLQDELNGGGNGRGEILTWLSAIY